MTVELSRRSLASVRAMRDDTGVISAYIDVSALQASTGGDQWRIEVKNRVRQLRERARAYGDHSYRVSVDRFLDDLEGLAESSMDPSSQGTRGLGLFYGIESRERIDIGSPARLPTALRIGERAYLLPLVAALQELAPFGLVELHRDEARVIGAGPAQNEELLRFRLDPDTSDWRQVSWLSASGKGAQQSDALRERFEGRLLEAVRKSLGVLAEKVAGIAGEGGWDVLAIYGDPRLAKEFQGALAQHPQAPATLTIDQVWGDLPAERVVRDALPAVEKQRKRRESELAGRIVDQASAGGKAVSGLRETSEALSSGRARTLIFDSSLIWMDGADPAVDAELRTTESVERAVDEALDSGIDVVAVSEDSAMESEKIGALLRW